MPEMSLKAHVLNLWSSGQQLLQRLEGSGLTARGMADGVSAGGEGVGGLFRRDMHSLKGGTS